MKQRQTSAGIFDEKFHVAFQWLEEFADCQWSGLEKPTWWKPRLYYDFLQTMQGRIWLKTRIRLMKSTVGSSLSALKQRTMEVWCFSKPNVELKPSRLNHGKTLSSWSLTDALTVTQLAQGVFHPPMYVQVTHEND